jgi:hypothetical protein
VRLGSFDVFFSAHLSIVSGYLVCTSKDLAIVISLDMRNPTQSGR